MPGPSACVCKGATPTSYAFCQLPSGNRLQAGGVQKHHDGWRAVPAAPRSCAHSFTPAWRCSYSHSQPEQRSPMTQALLTICAMLEGRCWCGLMPEALRREMRRRRRRSL